MLRIFSTIVSIVFTIILSSNFTNAQIPDSPDESIAGISVNYTESKVGNITLPEVLKTFDSQLVTDAKTWNEKRRPELLKYIENEYY